MQMLLICMQMRLCLYVIEDNIMQKRKYKYLVGDFETTVFENQEYTEVWASAVVEMFSEDVKIFHSISDTLDYLISLDTNVCIYYHNLKFDGAFWLAYLFNIGFEQASYPIGTEKFEVHFLPVREMKNNTFQYSISDLGQWYSIIIKTHSHYIEIRDSLKLLPFTVKQIGKSFQTKHKKLDMEYKGFRYAGCVITDEEKQYISNDVLVVKEALEIMFNEGHKELTIGSCCLKEYTKIIGGKDMFSALFPDITTFPLDEKIYGATNADEYIRRSYKGGWCYVVKGKENKIFYNGITADVNSLYPSMMSSESGNKYPVGLPTFWKGNYIPEEALDDDAYFFIRIRTRFEIKENKLPCIQIKNNYRYDSTEWLETSDVYYEPTNKHYKYIKNLDGTIELTSVVLTLTMTDYYLIKEHYELKDFEILDGCYFDSAIGIFDTYINKYKKIKLESTGAKRELAKLFLNNLYGKMASSKNSSFKYAFLRDDESVGFLEVKQAEKKAGFIPIGSAITSYARNFTIRHAQKNYYGVNKRGFIYADTDSIHCDLTPEELIDIQVDSKNFCCWKLEASWDKAYFSRQKTYIEHITHENLIPVQNLNPPKTPYLSIKCAGMPDRCKELLRMSMEGFSPEEYETLNPVEQKFVSTKRTFTDFKKELKVPSKLLPKRIKGGIVLQETTYEMR